MKGQIKKTIKISFVWTRSRIQFSHTLKKNKK